MFSLSEFTFLDTKAQRKAATKGSLMRPFFVPLCLCVFVSLDHILGNLYPRFPGKVPCLFISSVGMADNSDAWIVGKHSVQPVRHLVCAVGDDDLAGMQRIADSCAASM